MPNVFHAIRGATAALAHQYIDRKELSPPDAAEIPARIERKIGKLGAATGEDDKNTQRLVTFNREIKGTDNSQNGHARRSGMTVLLTGRLAELAGNPEQQLKESHLEIASRVLLRSCCHEFYMTTKDSGYEEITSLFSKPKHRVPRNLLHLDSDVNAISKDARIENVRNMALCLAKEDGGPSELKPTPGIQRDWRSFILENIDRINRQGATKDEATSLRDFLKDAALRIISRNDVDESRMLSAAVLLHGALSLAPSASTSERRIDGPRKSFLSRLSLALQSGEDSLEFMFAKQRRPESYLSPDTDLQIQNFGETIVPAYEHALVHLENRPDMLNILNEVIVEQLRTIEKGLLKEHSKFTKDRPNPEQVIASLKRDLDELFNKFKNTLNHPVFGEERFADKVEDFRRDLNQVLSTYRPLPWMPANTGEHLHAGDDDEIRPAPPLR